MVTIAVFQHRPSKGEYDDKDWFEADGFQKQDEDGDDMMMWLCHDDDDDDDYDDDDDDDWFETDRF